ncbi:cell cycle RNA binding protein whi3, partial [Ascosphaera pollenicola]
MGEVGEAIGFSNESSKLDKTGPSDPFNNPADDTEAVNDGNDDGDVIDDDDDDGNDTDNDEGEVEDDPSSENEEGTEPLPESLMQELERRKQNAVIQELAAQRAAAMTEEEMRQTVQSTDDYKLSMAKLLEKHDFATSINDPREYQIELFERAKTDNIIAVLDTGSGKTLIAVLLLKYMISRELESRALDKPPRISFFLVDSVTLVYQQAAVLQANLDQRVEKFCGAMGTDLWNKEIWDKHFNSNMVIVCTAEVLYQCLLHSFISIQQINLLIFDEAHHAKKDHPYARIIKDFYVPTIDTLRPKVFGMTASPVDAKVDVIKAAESLEALLDSRIATTSNLDLLRQSVARPTEEIWRYDRLKKPIETPLFTKLKENYGKLPVLKPLFNAALEANSILGHWCADLIFLYGLNEDVLPKLEGRAAKQPSAFSREGAKPAKEISQEEAQKVREAGEIVRSHDFGYPTDPDALSSKVRLLLERLTDRFSRPTDTKAIVFVKTRYTAQILSDLFKRVGPEFLHPDVLIGHRAHDPIQLNVTSREQFMVLVRFRKGDVNCLFATSIAEEGLDVPDCNLVVRFDLYSTVIQYVQSRGRARHKNSVFAQMVENGNYDHETAIKEVYRNEELARRFCSSLPDDRLLHKEQVLSGLMVKEVKRKSLTIPTTGAKLTFNSAISVLANYASSLQHDGETMTQVHYVMNRTPGGYICEAILPETSVIRGTCGKPASQKVLAKQSAAFETCVLLRKAGQLDDHLLSVVKKRRPAMRNAKLAIKSKKANQYKMKTKPSMWAESRGERPSQLSALMIFIIPSAPLRREHKPILFLTRQKLPKFPKFPIYLDDNVKCDVVAAPVGGVLDVSETEVDMLTKFTMDVFRDAFHKIYQHQPELMSYWLAPPTSDAEQDVSDIRLDSLIDWELLKSIHEGSVDNEWKPGAPPESIENKFIYDPWNGKYRYFTSIIDPDLRASDPVPPDAPRRRHMDSILSYCLNLFKNSRTRFLEHAVWDQPVVKAEVLGLRRNLLDEATEHELQKHACADVPICVQPLRISAIPIPLATTFFAFPAIIFRLEAYLIAQECCEYYGLSGIPLDLALEAVTKDSDNTEEHVAEQIQFQRGMGKNYERLEFFGDCFLKMATSMSIFSLHPDQDEFDYHVDRMTMLCNANLFKHAIESKMYKFVRSQSFSRRNWYPDGLNLLQGKSKTDATEDTHNLADKTIADICEALIGACLLTGGQNNRFDLAVKAVTAFVKHENHNVADWEGYRKIYALPKYQTTEANAAERDLAAKVEAVTGYHFKYPRLLKSAFMHPSYPSSWALVPCYQRLEFLGDSLYDMVCVEFLYAKYPDKDPQWLTEHKMAMVSNKFLGAL